MEPEMYEVVADNSGFGDPNSEVIATFLNKHDAFLFMEARLGTCCWDFPRCKWLTIRIKQSSPTKEI